MGIKDCTKCKREECDDVKCVAHPLNRKDIAWVDWPTEPGFYWFYGKRFKGHDEPEFNLARAFAIRSGRIMVVCESAFMYKEEYGGGHFTRITPPPAPEGVA